MKKVVVFCLGCGLFVAAYLGIWMQLPQVQDPTALKQAYDAGIAQYQAVANQVRDPESNGYLSPTFGAFWGGASEDPKGTAIVQWRSQAAVGDHRLMLETQNKGYLAARAAFEPLVEELHQEFQKPVFADPAPRLLHSFEAPHYRANVMFSAEALAGYALSLVAEGPSSEGVQTVVSLTKLGASLQSRGQLTERLQGVQVSELAFTVFVGTLQRHQSLTVEEWDLVTEAFTRAAPGPEHLSQGLEDEVTAGATTFIRLNERLFDEHPAIKHGSLLLRMPGMMVREERIYYNYLTSILELSKKEKALEEFPSPKGSWIAGDGGMLSGTLVSFPTNYPRRIQRLHLQLSMMELVTAILAHKTKTGAWPEELTGLEGAPAVSAGALKYAHAGDRAELHWKVPPALAELPGWPAPNDRFGTLDGAFVFRL